MSDRAFKALVILGIGIMILIASHGVRHDSYVQRCEEAGGTVFYSTPNASRTVCLTGFQKLKP
jgi:hypothetical protein